ncbi:hypothetical protein SteCoe_22544 [Stentor coeruleus]|uniref:Uncharacterized protein n=1 Tax=Stentor coeruleus TaxID=5963 RepID=A0A1R2BM38_9CILI|nr:hypothetical protein SteCoe_22544 [Stentor coeruleus]
MQEIPKDIKQLQDLVDFLTYDREILINENKRLKEIVEKNPWEKKYYEVLEKLEALQKTQGNSKKPSEPSKKLSDTRKQPKISIEETKKTTRRIRVSLKSSTPSAVLSPVASTKTLNKANLEFTQSKLDVTINKAYKTLITEKNQRKSSANKNRVTSPNTSLNMSRFGTPGRRSKN